MKRHDLVFLKPEGRKYAAEAAVKNHPTLEPEFIEQIIAGDEIPGIIKRQENMDAQNVALGFSTCHYTPEGSRIRLNSEVPRKYFAYLMNPFEVFQEAGQRGVYSEVEELQKKGNIKIGLFGSSALEVVTGQPYRNQNSDLDIYVKVQKDAESSLRELALGVGEIEKRNQICFDVEVEYWDKYGIKLKELLSMQKTVMAKGLYDVQLFIRDVVLQWI
ncbi:MAG: phosphoribosyl-dephospho-CoA transferase MdcG domain-containing protein [Lachnospiraceae bacterium]